MIDTRPPRIVEDPIELVRRLLRELGDTADEVAEELYTRGHKGLRWEAGACPIFRYLEGKLPAPPMIGPGSVCVGPHLVIGMPEAARQFVRRFDDGLYPHLLERLTGSGDSR